MINCNSTPMKMVSPKIFVISLSHYRPTSSHKSDPAFNVNSFVEESIITMGSLTVSST